MEGRNKSLEVVSFIAFHCIPLIPLYSLNYLAGIWKPLKTGEEGKGSRNQGQQSSYHLQYEKKPSKPIHYPLPVSPTQGRCKSGIPTAEGRDW